MDEPVPINAVRIVALGDSSVEAIGADRPMDGRVGRIADYITMRTGRPVHIVNVSTGGKARDIISNVLPKVDYTRRSNRRKSCVRGGRIAKAPTSSPTTPPATCRLIVGLFDLGAPALLIAAVAVGVVILGALLFNSYKGRLAAGKAAA